MRRLVATFAVYLAAVLVVTLWPSPQSTAAPGWAVAVVDAARSVGVPLTVTALEALANVVMFVPFGMLGSLLLLGAASAPRRAGARRASSPRAGTVGVLVVLAAGALSGAIELTQRVLPGRVPTVQDVVLNTAGGAVGVLAVLLTRAVRQMRTDRRERRDQSARSVTSPSR